MATLRARQEADATRRRRSFALHSSLIEPLRSWYQAVDALEPGRVVWEFPANGVPLPCPGLRPQRSDPARLDQLVSLLPSP